MAVGRLVGRLIGIVLGIALAGAAIYAAFFVDWRRDRVEPEPMVRPLKTLVVGERPIMVRRFPARVRASTEVVVAFEVPGKIEKLAVLRGQRVQRGDLLAQLDQRDFQTRLESSQAQFNQLSTELAAVNRAFAAGASTEIERARFQTAVQRARADLDLATKALEDATLVARFDGLVADVFVDQFQKVGVGAPVLRLQTDGIALVEVNVDPARVALARSLRDATSHSVRFDFMPGRELPAKLVEYTTQADSATQTFRALFEIVVPEDIVILPGMPATVVESAVAGAQPNAGELSVPVEAVAIDGVGSAHVWLVNDQADGTALVRRTDVDLGELVDGEIVITRGVKSGQTIAAAGVHHLVDGQRVRPLEPPQETDAR